MLESLQTINWETIGASLLSIMSVIAGIYFWLKKNIANIKQLKEDSADLTSQIKYYKAILKDSENLKSEISSQKLAMRSMQGEFKLLLTKKDQEIQELKDALNKAIIAIKEETKNGL